MTVLDIILSLITFLFQKMIIPLLPVNLPFMSFSAFNSTLIGLEHNLNWAFAGLTNFFNLKLLFTTLLLIISAEIIFWLFRAFKWIIEIIRG